MQTTDTVVGSNFDHKIGFIGGSRAGTAIASYLVKSGLNISGFYSFNVESAIRSAQITHTQAYLNIKDLLNASDIIIISVKDTAIAEIWHKIKEFNLKNKIICHLSGFLPATIFTEYTKYCLGIAAIHVPISFPDKATIPNEIYNSAFIVDGSHDALKIVAQIAVITKNPLLRIQSTNKAQYHAACVLSSSLVLSLLRMATKEAQQVLDTSVSNLELEKIFLNLTKSVLNNALDKEILAVITGPLIRGDEEMVQSHIQALSNPTSKSLYKTLSSSLLEELTLDPECQNKLQNVLQES